MKARRYPRLLTKRFFLLKSSLDHLREDLLRKIKLFIAASLDGYIARKDGGIDWLFTDADYGYGEFYSGVDTVLMGRKTYEQVLGFGEFPFKGKKNFVFTRQKDRAPEKHVSFFYGDVAGFSRSLKKEEGKDIWLVGGAEIIAILNRERLIDEYIISIHPVILGSGIALFKEEGREAKLELLGSKAYSSGLVQLSYALRPE